VNHWLLKSEPSLFSIDDLEAAPGKTTGWEGVRNFQARNMLRDDVKKGDLALFYHSSCPEPGVAGIVEVVRSGYPDPSAWNPRSEYFDAKSPEKKPLWYAVDLTARLAQDDVVLTLVKDGDHRLSRPEDVERMLAAVAEF